MIAKAFSEPPPSASGSVKSLDDDCGSSKSRKDAPSSRDIGDEYRPRPRISTIELDSWFISDAIASQVAASLLGRVLFLKGQIPMPVSRLSNMPSSHQTSPRALKLRTDLLEAYDVLSSHLDSTFSSLSTAFARCRRKPVRRQCFLAFLLGPTISNSKAKVVLGVDGFYERIWGIREEEQEFDDEESSSDTEEPPLSDDEETDSEEGWPNETDDTTPSPPADLPPEKSASSRRLPSYEEELKLLKIAERFLSRILATDDSMADELAPTQTHVLLLAPRRFIHPSWMPRQNIGNSLNGMLDEFRRDSQLPFPADNTDAKKLPSKKKSKPTEGVWLSATRSRPSKGTGDSEPTLTQCHQEEDEDDELIWWSWDGKIVGFNEW